MADDEVGVPRDALKGLLTGKDTLSRFIEGILNQILEAQMTEHLKARPHERTQERQGYATVSRLAAGLDIQGQGPCQPKAGSSLPLPDVRCDS